MGDFNDSQTGSYDGQDTTGNFMVGSTIDFPDMRLSDPVPGGTLDQIDNCGFRGVGTGGENILGDGSVETRYKADSTYGGTGNSGVDGGTP